MLRDRKSNSPEAANGRVKAIRSLFAWAIENEEGGVEVNPAKAVRYFAGSAEGFHTWTLEEIVEFETHHSAVATDQNLPAATRARSRKALLALALLMFTGVRRSDLVRLGRQNVRDGWLRFTEAKGRAHVAKDRELPVLPELQRAIDCTPRGNMTFLVTEFGSSFTPARFGNWFADRCREAGVPGRAHGLRKAGATIAANNGASDSQLMAIFGWTTAKQAGVYTRKANRRKLAGDAMHLLVPGTNLSHRNDGFSAVGKNRT